MNFFSEPVLKFESAEHDEMLIDSASAPTQAILGMLPLPNRRGGYSYSISATEWTEYTSPLANPRTNFYIDSAGDPISTTYNQLSMANSEMPVADAGENCVTNQIRSSDAAISAVSAAEQALNGSDDLSNEIILSQEQKHVLDLVRAGQK